MDNKMNLTKFELNILLKADDEIALKGYTKLKCPRCNSNILCEEHEKSYTIKCSRKDCISTKFRGI